MSWMRHEMLRRSLIAALLLVFVDVMKELPATLVLRPFNTDTLAVMAYQLARDERLGEARFAEHITHQGFTRRGGVTDDAVVPDLNALFDLLVNRLVETLR